MVITLGTVITVFVAWFLVTSIIVVKLVKEDLPAGLVPYVYMISALACAVIWLIDRNWDRVLFKI